MKKNAVKKMTVLAAAVVMGLAMAACGGKEQETAVSQEAAAEETGLEETAAEETEAEETAAEETEEKAQDTAPAVPEEEDETADGVLTEEEYVEQAQQLIEDMSGTMTRAKEELDAMDPNDLDAAREFMEGLKEPFVNFAALQAPEKFAAAQEKFKSGCDAMVEYLDFCLAMMDEETAAELDQEEAVAKITELAVAMQNDFIEAATMMDELTAGTDDTQDAVAE